MRDHERAMLAYARLAAVSARKRQLAGRDRLLVLAAAAACRAGWPEVAARCRQLVLEHNPRHVIGRCETVADSLRDEDFQAFVKQLERTCPYERAEHLLAGPAGRFPNPSVEQPTAKPSAAEGEPPPTTNAGRQALAILDEAAPEQPPHE